MINTPFFDRYLLRDVTGAQTSAGVELAGVREIVAYVIGGAGVAAGAIQLEEAPDVNYAGTWAAIGAPIGVTAGAVASLHVTGTFKAVRARASTAIAGGNASVLLVAS